MMVSYYLDENDVKAVESNFNWFNSQFKDYRLIFKEVTGKEVSFGHIDRDQIKIIR